MTSDVELYPDTIPGRNLQCTLSFPWANGCGKNCWNSCNIRFFGFLQSCITKWSVLKMAIHNVVGLLLRCAWATCRFGPFVMQCQVIDVIASFNMSLSARLSNKSSSLYAHCRVSIGSSFTLFSIISSIGSFLAMTKVNLWLTVMVCFK